MASSVKTSQLVIVPCGQQKIWGKHPNAGSTLAKDAYIGTPFKVNRAFAERFGHRWLILSAKYGFIEPEFPIPGPYNVTFKRRSSGPISIAELKEQVGALALNEFDCVVGLGGKEYRQAIEQAFESTGMPLRFPVAGLSIGRAMQSLRKAMTVNRSFFEARARTARNVNETPATIDMALESACETCVSLHALLNGLRRFRFPFDVEQIPRNGIYVLFEDGECAHGVERIVRVGTHTGDRQLRSRLVQHFVKERKDRSIFRKNVGRCLLRRDGDAFADSWEIDLTTRAAREKYEDRVDPARQKEIEIQVTDYMRAHFSFAVFEVTTKAQRLELESKIASTVSLCKSCGPSQTWLGIHSPNSKIRTSGLWQVNELYKTPLSAADFTELRALIR